jgi:acyl-CoA reductase-like NAD-dependent aldehyde dehydrogenase
VSPAVTASTEAQIRAVARASVASQSQWLTTAVATRRQLLRAWADVIEARRDDFVGAIVREVRKPVAMADDEVTRACAHIRTAANLPDALFATATVIAPGVRVVPRPLGVVAIIMPWNNPLALPVGKIAPAVMAGNGVIFKPAPEANGVAQLIMETVSAIALPEGLVGIVAGGRDVGDALVRSPEISGVAVTGSVGTGRAIGEACLTLGKPVQAELGGNNAAIIMSDADLTDVVPRLMNNAFAYAGQRCTALRRFVVLRSHLEAFVALAKTATLAQAVGDPRESETRVGPVISFVAAERIASAIELARSTGCDVLAGGELRVVGTDSWVTPALIVAHDANNAIVQEETFGPVAVIQPADDLDHAVALANGVEQGLVMAICGVDPELRQQLADRALVGIVQFGADAVAVHPDAPFGGWKASGTGRPEHGEWDMQFFTRPQVIYADTHGA